MLKCCWWIETCYRFHTPCLPTLNIKFGKSWSIKRMIVISLTLSFYAIAGRSFKFWSTWKLSSPCAQISVLLGGEMKWQTWKCKYSKTCSSIHASKYILFDGNRCPSFISIVQIGPILQCLHTCLTSVNLNRHEISSGTDFYFFRLFHVTSIFIYLSLSHTHIQTDAR